MRSRLPLFCVASGKVGFMAKNAVALYAEITALAVDYLSSRPNPELVKKYARYFKEYDAWGNSDEDLKGIVSTITERYPALSLADIFLLGSQLFKVGKYESGSVAIRLLNSRTAEYDKSVLPGLKTWFDAGINNWGHSDVLCSTAIGELFRKGLVNYKDFSDWRTSASHWTRRAVPVSLLAVRKTEQPETLISFIEPMLRDEVREVHQGLGWFLRELWKIHPGPVEDLLFKYRNISARLIFQYATEKMTKEQKERFRKEKPVRPK